MKTSSLRRYTPLLLALVIGLTAVGAASYFRPFVSQSDPGLLGTDDSILVSPRPFGTVFSPKSGASTLGFVFYPGARVPREAYAYLGKGLARAGYTTVLLSLPLNFAIFAPSKAKAAMAALPEVSAWVVGGHSLGGVVAASFASSGAAAKRVVGLVLLAAYPQKSSKLATWGHPALSIGAGNDGLVSQGAIAQRRAFLPPQTRYVEIAGGNHAQFGSYGAQPGDGVASLSPESQHRAVTEEILALLDAILAGKR